MVECPGTRVVDVGAVCRPIRSHLPRVPGFRPAPHRRIVERTFAWIGHNRRMSRDGDFLEASSEAWIYLSMIRLMLKRMAHEHIQPAFHYRRIA